MMNLPYLLTLSLYLYCFLLSFDGFWKRQVIGVNQFVYFFLLKLHIGPHPEELWFSYVFTFSTGV